MKKLTALLLAILMSLALSACGSKTIAIGSLYISPETLEITVEESQPLSVAILPEDATETISWSSMDESIATVDENGCVQALAVGSTTIVVSAAESGISAKCDVIVKDKAAYDQLSDLEKDFVDIFVRYGAPEFVQPETIEIQSIYMHQLDEFGDTWIVTMSVANGWGGVTGNTFYLLRDAYMGSHLLKGEESLLTTKDYNIDLVNQAIQEQLAS